MSVSPIVQYVVVRGDLITKLQWPIGAVIAQACHSCTAVIHLYYNDDTTKEYLGELDRMHKIILEAKDEESITKLAENLTSHNIGHKLWIEQPENTPTCLAVKPYRKSDVQQFFKAFKLLK
ncbi:putative peptidyl-tRNA hydrolase PTRHD1 [Physella acuta]|uniref:putative peptidyl-tRNA hydrolase PTRHD1 n=1 Tax=Physella acuta TaxID=109671 RepID=UPI0027DB8873|nr:putative peptidyl-tRNA hydrolase PTRHD1 [Physella acuta]XP_059172910.1 putative peptidyl-tRNA hydrolase PTRHD1 [Physella acuta]